MHVELINGWYVEFYRGMSAEGVASYRSMYESRKPRTAKLKIGDEVRFSPWWIKYQLKRLTDKWVNAHLTPMRGIVKRVTPGEIVPSKVGVRPIRVQVEWDNTNIIFEYDVLQLVRVKK